MARHPPRAEPSVARPRRSSGKEDVIINAQPVETPRLPVAPNPALASDEQLASLTNRFALRHPPQVHDYLRRHPRLVPLLVEASSVLPSYFGDEFALALEVFIDPEDPDETPDLFAFFGAPGGRDELNRRLDRFDEEWFHDRSPLEIGVLVWEIEAR